jgi:hypothetical protein
MTTAIIMEMVTTKAAAMEITMAMKARMGSETTMAMEARMG